MVPRAEEIVPRANGKSTHLWCPVVPRADDVAVVAILKGGTAKVNHPDGAVHWHPSLHPAQHNIHTPGTM
jgi:hypothetical protein